VGFIGYAVVAGCMILSALTMGMAQYSMGKMLRRLLLCVSNCAGCFQAVMMIWLPIAALKIGTLYCSGMYQFDPNSGAEVQITVLESQ